MTTVYVSPIELAIGDRVEAHGAIFEVMHVVESKCDVPGGIRVAACISRLVGDDCGAIPRSWLDTPKSLRDRGCGDWACGLPDGRYFNVQGNAHARVRKIID